jgi:CelD/BcsL family acetyltransferase involved in cellulose biosynthesis
MTAEIIDTTAGLHALAPEWAALWHQTPAATPFQHPAWLLPWWASFGTRHPRIATWREHGNLCGILPAYILDEESGRKLLPIGVGTTDYLDALGEGIPEMLAALLHRCTADNVRTVDLIDILPTSTLPNFPPPPGWQATWTPGNPCPVLDLAQIPAAIRRKVRMNRNRATRAGGYTVEHAGPAG